ncbi:hypothetical protein [Algoriphagus litoralis]|uniref:hypothetical protein n=1 Tax=Algoriphagus litoralis TaxID=2202829 RepID=UPI001300B538|nr:hypothetical protein [Algoriphagus litoralis]
MFWSTLGALALLVIWNLPWRFQVNDDEVMMWLVSGAYTGQPEPYAVFIHPILSWAFAQAYLVAPKINWYGGLFFCVIGLSCFLLFGKIAVWKESFWVKTFVSFLILSTALHFAIFPQFTYVAGFAAFASLSVWFGASPQKHWPPRYLSIGLFILAVLIRWESVALIGIGFGTFGLILKGFSFLRIEFKNLLLISIIFLSLSGFKYIWEKQSDYSNFLKFNKVRSGVIDHPVFRQEIVDGEIQPNSEFYFFSRWYFEGDFPSEKDLIEKKRSLDSQLFTKKQVFKALERLWQVQRVEAFKSVLILIFILIFWFSAIKSARLRIFFLIWIAFFLLFNHFFLLQGRVVILFFLCLLFPVFYSSFSSLPTVLSKILIVILPLLLSFHFVNFLKEAKGRKIMDLEFSELKSKVDPDVPIIMEGFQEHNSEIHYTRINKVPFLTTGWISRSPFQKKALNRFGFDSFGEIKEYVLLSPSTNLEIVFPDYMNSTFGEFIQIDSLQTDNFIFLRFSKK